MQKISFKKIAADGADYSRLYSWMQAIFLYQSWSATRQKLMTLRKADDDVLPFCQSE